MIGDYISTPSAITNIEGVAEIYPGGVITRDGRPWLEDEIKPIPLTPEILVKNGFTNGEFYAESHIEDWQIMSDCSNLAARSKRGWSIDIPCRYVHELQHTLRLCGIEKEIVL